MSEEKNDVALNLTNNFEEYVKEITESKVPAKKRSVSKKSSTEQKEKPVLTDALIKIWHKDSMIEFNELCDALEASFKKLKKLETVSVNKQGIETIEQLALTVHDGIWSIIKFVFKDPQKLLEAFDEKNKSKYKRGAEIRSALRTWMDFESMLNNLLSELKQ